MDALRMCHNTDGIYSTNQTAVVRASQDFHPRDPASHTVHISSVAYNSFFLGEIMLPDWDMFHSLHPAADYHAAAARAIGGCPIYVSDKPGNHNFELLRKLVLPDGSILSACLPGRPTRDCLFTDPVEMAPGAGWCKLAKRIQIHDSSPSQLSGSVRATDVESISDLAGPNWNGDVAVYCPRTGKLVRLPKAATLPVPLKVPEYELFHFCPIQEITSNLLVAPIGLLGMFNSAGSLEEFNVHTEKNLEELYGKASSEQSSTVHSPAVATITLKARECGCMGVYISQRPLTCTVGGLKIEYDFNSDTGLLAFTLAVPQEELYRWSIEIVV